MISVVALDANDNGNRNDTKDDNLEKNDGNPKSNISVFFTKEVLYEVTIMIILIRWFLSKRNTRTSWSVSTMPWSIQM